MAARLSVTAVRHADPEDLPLLAGIEAAADEMFASVMDPSQWPAPTSGEARAAQPGFLLAIGQPVLGFAHVIELADGRLHLDQIAVHPRAQRRRAGTMLLHAALGLARAAGAPSLTLMTYADVPWNAPWYAKHGFFELTAQGDPEAYAVLAPLRQAETQLGLDRGGRRVAMTRLLVDGPTPIPAVSVIPVRDGPRGLEVFVQHRAATMDFVPGAVVFPGGRIDAIDREQAPKRRIVPDHVAFGHARRWERTAYAALGAGLCTGEPGTEALAAARVIVETAVREVQEETGARIDPVDLIPWDNWITPETAPKRFDVFFHLLPVALDADPRVEFTHLTREATRSEWTLVTDLVAAVEAGDVLMVSPTRTLVDELSAIGTVPALIDRRPEIVAVHHEVVDEARPRRAD